MDTNVEKFIEFVKQDCKDNNIEFELNPNKSVNFSGTECNGYFDEEERKLTLGTDKSFEEWFKILIHEYAHMTQWKDDCIEWKRSKVVPGGTETLVDLWTNHEIELNEFQLDRHWRAARDLEIDCEKRTVELIKKFNLPVDIGKYIRDANAYLYFWTYLKEEREWYKIGNEPYRNRWILSLMPSAFTNDYDNPPEVMWRLFKGIMKEGQK